tara:strand:- start:516 stop:782 length:267 start_codon:yes stop_codon:yes gene_type:complete
MVTSGKARRCLVQVSENRTEATFRSIPDNRWPHCAWDCKREAWLLGGVGSNDQSNRPPASSRALRPESGERTVAGEPINHADKRARPF